MKKVSKFLFVPYDEAKSYVSQKEFYSIVNNKDNFIPTRATSGSCGYDFHMIQDITINPGESKFVPTLIRCKIKKGWMLMIVPKSGLGCKYKLRLSNTAGIIDSDYFSADNYGHIIIKLSNEGTEPITLKKGSSFCQGIFLKFGITEDDYARPKEKRHGGFGSTTK